MKWLPTTRREYALSAFIAILGIFELVQSIISGENALVSYIVDTISVAAIVLSAGALVAATVTRRRRSGPN